MKMRIFARMSGALLSWSVMAAPAVASTEMSDTAIMDALQDAFMMHFNYGGTIRKKFDQGYGIGCKKERDFLLHWESMLRDLDVSINDQGIARFGFRLKDSKAYVSYTGKNSLCIFKGYMGDVITDNIRGEFHIIPQGPGKSALIDIKALELDRLRFENWTLFEPFLYDIRGDAPDFINDWAQRSFNGVVKAFLKSSFSDRLDRYVSDKVEDALRKRYEEQHGVLQSAPAPRSSPLLH